MNKRKQVIQVFFLSLFISIMSLCMNVFAAEAIGSISNPASLKVGGGIHKFSFKKSEEGKIITSQLGISLEEIKSGSEAEAFDKEFNSLSNEEYDSTSIFYIPKTPTTNLYIFKFKLYFYSSDTPTEIKAFDVLSQNGFYTQDNVPINATEYTTFNYCDNNEYLKELTVGTDSKTNSATLYYAVYLDDFKSGQYPIIELKNMGLLRYNSFVNTDPNYEPDTDVNSTTSSKINIANVKISGIKSKIYNGKNQYQSITIKNGSTVLKKDVDYKLYYTHNKNVGAGIIYIMGIGNYYGHRLTSFIISPPAPSLVKINKQTSDEIKLSWTKVSTAAGYSIYMYHPVKKKWIEKTYVVSSFNTASIKTDYDNKPLKPAAGYLFRIVPYKIYLNTLTMNFNSAEYAFKSVPVYTRPAQAKILKIASNAKGTISVSYSKSARVSGYLVQVYNYDKKLIKKVVTKGNYAKFTGLASNKKYIVKVIPYKLVNKKPLYCANPSYRSIVTK